MFFMLTSCVVFPLFPEKSTISQRIGVIPGLKLLFTKSPSRIHSPESGSVFLQSLLEVKLCIMVGRGSAISKINGGKISRSISSPTISLDMVSGGRMSGDRVSLTIIV